MPRCIIIAGPNGSGKTTFAEEFLPHEDGNGLLQFINTDIIARELALRIARRIPSFTPEKATRLGARKAIKAMRAAVAERLDFAIETTLSGRTHATFIRDWKKAGYTIELAYLKMEIAELAIQRVNMRVKQGGHFVPEEDIRRRVTRSWQNFNETYKDLADDWWVFDASSQELLDSKFNVHTFKGWKL